MIGQDTVAVTKQRPDRDGRWQHQLQLRNGFGYSQLDQNWWGSDIGRNRLGLGLDYHFLRGFEKWTAGLGVGYEVLDAPREEYLGSLTGLFEYRMGRGRVRTYTRLTGGINLSSGRGLPSNVERKLGSVVHPAIGLAFRTVYVDVGYRFSRVDTVAGMEDTNEFSSRRNYRRLTVTTGVRF